MRYTLLMHYPEPKEGELELPPEAIAEAQTQMSAYVTALHQAGVLLSAEVLSPSPLTTTLTMDGGAVQVKDGPFADTKEQLGGTFVIDVDDLDAAIEWARQAPPLQWGAVEIRPGATHVEDGQWVSGTRSDECPSAPPSS
ncbi:hypothetical protein DFO66_11645 [Brevibacterium sanguinis]|uniref:YCII-related domain-containing protein n=2 Tax=Brevibacterium TaxID=1696 RepID=A0A366IGE8_9MICO|nr:MULTISPECIES: YciI family protein [Brevibacterium]RBP62229.1 hypothetical protein DFO66_11645 [Brevibacterium sanguinis]RBP70639.1 hypothetical protein DFO65_10891 [Brevibacterium celere]